MPAERMVFPAVWLTSLFLVSLVVFTDDYVIAGILLELARDLAVSDGMAGQLITIFSLTIAIAAPVIAVFFKAFDRKRLMLFALLIFACANLVAALATSFNLLMVMRIVAALCAAAITPSLFAAAASMTRPVGPGVR